MGDPINTKDDKISSWSALTPFVVGSYEVEVGTVFNGSINRFPKKYSWDASGSIELVPYVWKWGIAGIIPTGGWDAADKKFHTTKTPSTGGTWTVERNWTRLSKKTLSDGSGSGSGSTSTPTPTPSPMPSVDDTPDCSYCTGGCSACQQPYNDDDSEDDDDETQVTCPRCGGLWTKGEAAPICPFGVPDQGYCFE